MGIAERLSALFDLPSTSDEQAEMMFESFKMLVSPEQMGKKFKTLCITHESLIGKVVGF
jgi:SAM-dependent MidA family methyltransferase